LASETATDDLWNRLQAANLHIEELEQQLAQKDTEFVGCKLSLRSPSRNCKRTRIFCSLEGKARENIS
jgi:hypothetical protein